ncbi:MAG: phosphoesterase, partial [Planctomycetota bacterium]
MSVDQELVLVLPTKVLHDIGHFEGFSTEVEKYLPALLGCGELGYRPRGQMEEDPSFKQLIPYCMFRYTDEQGVVHLFNYRRGGGSGEARLRAKRSVGVGGHISTLDGDVSRDDPPNEVYRRGLQRELAEEVAVESPSRESCVGLINDEATPVGRVHLGVVHVFDL